MIETIDGLYRRICTNPAHYKCRAYTFTFDLPDDPARGEYTIVARGVDDCAAYVRAYRFLFAECIDGDDIPRLTQQETGEPSPTSLYSWNESRDCTFDVEIP
ncbi:hypothetical protein ABWK57_13915 [Streptomyces sp. NPDC094045]|uniref:hypothetical protein n=1 Tax=Streptomyces sp. NPDC094045 TaxID=3161019 RepID=UPI003391F647